MFQFPSPCPSDCALPPSASSFERFVACLLLSFIAVSLISFLLPPPIFRKLFKIAFPFMPDRLEDWDDKD